MQSIDKAPVNLQGVAVPADHISLPVHAGRFASPAIHMAARGLSLCS